MTDWIQRWKDSKIGWHSESINDSLTKFIECLGLMPGDLVFVPLCGKTKDMIHFINQGFKVIGVEISELGIKQFFDENDISYSVKVLDNFVFYYNDDISIYCGDYFDLNADILSSVVGVYDRASLIALPVDLRRKYASHLYSIIPTDSKVLLLTIDYPQLKKSGPPFAVSNNEVELLYSDGFDFQLLERIEDNVEPKFIDVGINFFETATYCLHKKKEGKMIRKMKGTVSQFGTKGYGFIMGDDGEKYFVHQKNIKNKSRLRADTRVVFGTESTEKGLVAINVGLEKQKTESGPLTDSSIKAMFLVLFIVQSIVVYEVFFNP